MSLSRRDFGASVAALAVTGGGQPYVGALLRQLAVWPRGPVLLNSYMVEPGGGDFDLTQANAAYVYDNALAGLLLLAAGQRAQALRIGTALALAQAHDRTFADGRLRNGYAAGVMDMPAKLPGFWDAKAGRWAEDPYQLGTATGPLAWAMLLWSALGMRGPANAAGDFVTKNLAAPTGYYGGFYGFDPTQQILRWQSTEQNLDLAVAFHRLGRAAESAHAAAFVRAMHRGGHFITGLAPDGTPNPLLAADAGIWPYLAGLDDAAGALAVINGLRRGSGIGFSAASTGIWLEGTAFAALALRKMGKPLAQSFFATLAANLSPSGYVFATVAPQLATGFSVGPALQKNTPALPFNYVRRPALSATSWAGLAARGVNPLDATLAL